MRVLLIQMNVLSKRNSILNPRVYPLGLSYVGTALKLRGHNVGIFDPSVMREPLDELRAKVMEMEPDVVGICLRHIYPSPDIVIEQCGQFMKEIRKIGPPEVKILIGGPSFSLDPETIMKHIPEIDYGILYEGEESVPELIENFENPEMTKGIFLRRGESIIFTGERERIDFRAFPMPKRDLCDINPYLDQPYHIGVQTKRGCIMKCIYCAYSNIDGTNLRLRRPEHVADEIEHLVNQYGIRSFTFAENVFNVPVYHAEQICREMIRRKIDVQWTAWFHEKYITREFVELAREAGCNRFEFSPDGFSDQSLKKLEKGMTKRDIINAYNIIKRMKGIKVRYNFFLWPPGQDFVTLFKLILFRLKMKLTLRNRLLTSGLGTIIINKNTKLQEIAIQHGIIKEDTDLFFSTVEYLNSKLIGTFFKIKRFFVLKRQ